MYLQVYLHKTSLAAELILLKLFRRFKVLIKEKKEFISNSHILYPLINSKSEIDLSQKVLIYYFSLEDSDILFLLKSWTKHDDIVLSSLSKQIIYRSLPKIQIQEKPFKKIQLLKKINLLKKENLQKSEYNYFAFTGSISSQTYITDHSQIFLKNKSECPVLLTEIIDYLDFSYFSEPIYRYYLCYPK